MSRFEFGKHWALAATVVLSACGGGGGGSATTTSSDAPLAAEAPTSTALQGVALPDSASVVQIALGEKLSESRINRTVYEYAYRLKVVNGAQPVQGLTARLTGGGTGLTVAQGTVYIGDLANGASATPAGTVTIRQDRTQPFNAEALTWTLATFQAPSAASCAALATIASETSLFPANVKVTAAALVAANGTTPEHCNLLGTINDRQGAQSSPGVAQKYAIKWQVRLPTTWNGRFSMQGGGGLDGSIPETTSRLPQGYATAADDSGHDNSTNSDDLAAGAGAFGTDFDARVDFAYRAIDLTQKVAKGLIQVYYDKAPEHSYFEGCSMGGRESMMVTQKLPTAFDGVVVGDPAFKFSGVLSKSVYISQLFGKLAGSMGFFTANGIPLASNAYTNQDLQIVSNAILGACDALDGLADGMVNSPLQCTTNVVAPFLNARQCIGAKTASCLSADQIDTIRKYYEGPVTPTGQRPYAGWMWDPGIAGCTSAADCNSPTATNIATGWRTWNLGTYAASPATAINTASAYSGNRGGAAATVVVPSPPVLPSPIANEGTTKILMNYDLDQFVASTRATTPAFPISGRDLFDVDSTDLTPFSSRGGKVVIYQPQTGGPFSPLAMVDWYRGLNAAAGGTDSDYSKVQAFARLFLMPGAQHCGGGPSTSNIDPFGAVVDWVEKGQAPAKLIGTAPSSTPWPGRTRPLCPFPQAARYSGSGSIEVESSFTCQ